MQYNNAQYMAIKHGVKPMLVIAGPGSGKTTVLTSRVKYLIEKYQVKPEKILVITFTKAAAKEMESRFASLMGQKSMVSFGTFHAVFFKILRSVYNYNIDNIIREDRRNFILRQAVERSGAEPDDMNEFIELISGEISRVKTNMYDINAYSSTNCARDVFCKIFNFYKDSLRQRRLIDFDDMLLDCYKLLRERQDVQKAWQNKYEYILVDEFQDINPIQYEIVKMLALPQNNLFIVGDDDQSIYGFRGSKPEIMLGFKKDYPDAKIVVLDTNYRCSGNIVEAAGRVIANNKTRFDKNISTINEAGAKVDILEFRNMNEEYERIATDIRKGIFAGKSPQDYAILFRTNSIAAPLVRKLMEMNISFSIKDGIPNVFEHWIAKDIITYINIALGSRRRSDFLQIINKPKRYIGRDYLTSETVSFEELEKYYEDKKYMLEKLDKLKSDLRRISTMPPYAMVNYIRKGVGYDDYLAEFADNHGIEAEELYAVADEIMESSSDFGHIKLWFDYITDYSKILKEKARQSGTDNSGVVLTTMHSSKGLEYDTVYIIDANEEITPHKKSVFESEIEEERRMFYVAMTRAKNKLVITYPKVRFNKEMEVSRFINEIMQ